MSLEIDSGEGTERLKETVAEAVRGALGERVDLGTWRLALRRLPMRQGFLVDLTNLNGISRQWVFEDGDGPIAQVIKRDLKPVS